MDMDMDLVMKDTLSLSVAQFNMYSIYNMYKRVSVRWSPPCLRSAIESNENTSVYFKCPIWIVN